MQIELLRRASPGRRIELAFQLSALVRTGVRAAIDRRYPHETRDERDRIFLAELYGKELAETFIAFRRKRFGPMNEKRS